jgi:hypothetical protein
MPTAHFDPTYWHKVALRPETKEQAMSLGEWTETIPTETGCYAVQWPDGKIEWLACSGQYRPECRANFLGLLGGRMRWLHPSEFQEGCLFQRLSHTLPPPMVPKIGRCVYCGSKARLRGDMDDGELMWRVECLRCQAGSPRMSDREGSVEAWNRVGLLMSSSDPRKGG